MDTGLLLSPKHFIFLILLLYSSRAGQQNTECGRIDLEICCCYMRHQLSRAKEACQPKTKLKKMYLVFLQKRIIWERIERSKVCL